MVVRAFCVFKGQGFLYWSGYIVYKQLIISFCKLTTFDSFSFINFVLFDHSCLHKMDDLLADFSYLTLDAPTNDDSCSDLSYLTMSTGFEFDYASQAFDDFMGSSYDENKADEEEEAVELDNKKKKKKKDKKTKRRNLIIWDWDDTLFPTYSFRTHQDSKDAAFMKKLMILVSYIAEIFSAMIDLYGAENIVIGTNASDKWIDKCLNVDIVQSIFMNFQSMLKEHRIATISASTDRITAKYPEDHRKWKEVVFSEYFRDYFFEEEDEEHAVCTNCITSIGDSLCEYEASHNASQWVKNRVLHRIRLKANPSMNDMIFQLKEIAALTHRFGADLDGIEKDYSAMGDPASPSSSSCSDSTCSDI